MSQILLGVLILFLGVFSAFVYLVAGITWLCVLGQKNDSLLLSFAYVLFWPVMVPFRFCAVTSKPLWEELKKIANR